MDQGTGGANSGERPAAGGGPPPRPGAETRAELSFTRQRMVRWLSPGQLLDTGRRALLAVIISGYSDKREVEAALPSPGILDRSASSELWVDYVADLGDGFNPTYALASLLAQPVLGLGGGEHETRQGQVLVMGGDQVYPAATLRRYQDRLSGPYRAALPYREVDPPTLLAVPGNHDWYDGLTSFVRLFCQQEWIGGWRTSQTRSYFALKLPHRWWLWGIDIQFDNYIDGPQLRYFRDEVAPSLDPGDGLILCVAKPSWVDANASEPHPHPDVATTLDYFERQVIRPRGVRVRLALSGDRHHYARYTEVDGDRHRLTCGGGGAFLTSTHGLPDRIMVPPPTSSDPGRTDPVAYRLAQAYPDKERSSRLTRGGVWRLLWRNDALPVFVGAVAMLLALMARGAIGPRDGFWDVPAAWARGALPVLFLAGLAFGLVRFTKIRGPTAWLLGGSHFLAQVSAIAATIWLASRLLGGVGGGWRLPLVLALTGAAYAVVGCLLLALYLVVADLFRVNRTELFSAMRIEDMKSFLRIRIDATGCTVYPVKVERVPRRWRLKPGGDPVAPWFEADDGPPAPELIEPPLVIPR